MKKKLISVCLVAIFALSLVFGSAVSAASRQSNCSHTNHTMEIVCNYKHATQFGRKENTIVDFETGSFLKGSTMFRRPGKEDLLICVGCGHVYGEYPWLPAGESKTRN